MRSFPCWQAGGSWDKCKVLVGAHCVLDRKNVLDWTACKISAGISIVLGSGTPRCI